MTRTLDALEPPRSLVAVLFVCLSACASSSNEGTDDGTGKNGEPICRSYATEYQVTSLEAEELGICEFDRPSLTMSCRRISSAPYEQLTTWDTIEAFVAENSPLGWATRRRDTLIFANTCSVVHDYVYDSRERLSSTEVSTSGDSCGGPSVVYDAWDDDGRPTHGTRNGVGLLACMGQDASLSYDDDARIVTVVYSGGTSCRDETISLTYDHDGIVISSAYSSLGSDPVVSTFTIEGRAEICTE